MESQRTIRVTEEVLHKGPHIGEAWDGSAYPLSYSREPTHMPHYGTHPHAALSNPPSLYRTRPHAALSNPPSCRSIKPTHMPFSRANPLTWRSIKPALVPLYQTPSHAARSNPLTCPSGSGPLACTDHAAEPRCEAAAAAEPRGPARDPRRPAACLPHHRRRL